MSSCIFQRITGVVDLLRRQMVLLAFEGGSSVILDNPKKHQERSDALECGSLLFLPSWEAKTPFAQEIAKASFNTMHARMDIEPEEWMHWRQPNKAIFVIRSWGGILWR